MPTWIRRIFVWRYYMKISFPQQVFWSMPILFAFLLPFGGILLSIVIMFWLLLSFFYTKRLAVSEGLKKKAFWLPVLFFVFTCVSAALSNNHKEAAVAIEIKLSFILLPWLFCCFAYPTHVIKRALIAFVSGNFFACVYLLLRASVYAFQGGTEYFFYTKFSDFIHASYFSMYLIFAIVIMVKYYGQWFMQQKEMRYLSYLFMSLFSLCVFLCSSKLGILSYFVLMPVLFFHQHKQFLKLKYLGISFLACAILFLAAYNIFPDSFQRLQSLGNVNLAKIDKTSKESTTVRILIWQQAVHLCLQSPFTGVGVGDANDALYQAYADNGLSGALHYHLNAHNQYLQTFLGLGLFGLLLLFEFTWVQMIRAIRRKYFLMFVFAFLIALNFLVESMLQTAAGVLFFMYFYAILSTHSHKELSHA